MHFEYPAKAEAFRTELREFMDQEIPDWWSNILSDDEGSYEFSPRILQKTRRQGLAHHGMAQGIWRPRSRCMVPECLARRECGAWANRAGSSIRASISSVLRS